MSKKLEAWGRSDLVAEILRLRADNELLRKRLGPGPSPPFDDIAATIARRDADVAALSLSPSSAVDALFPDFVSKPAPERVVRIAEIRERDDGRIEISHAVAVGQTDLALHVRIDGEEHWFLKSAIHEDSETYRMGTSGTLIVPRRLAEEKGLV